MERLPARYKVCAPFLFSPYRLGRFSFTEIGTISRRLGLTPIARVGSVQPPGSAADAGDAAARV
jgi:hypothetical protein